MSWLLEAADFTDRRLPVDPGRPAGIYSKKAVKASSAKIAGLIDTAIAIQEEDANTANGQIGYIALVMIWASMPHKKIDQAHYKLDNGATSITMFANPDIGLPYGKLPRLICAWLTQEARRTKSPVLMLGRSLNEFADKLGLSTSGGQRGDISRLKVQARKLFSTVITLNAHDDRELAYSNVLISNNGLLLWNPKKPHARSLWESTITLSEPFYQQCIKRAVPFDLRVLHILRSPLAIDIYFWLTWRIFLINRQGRPTLISWEALRLQFCVGYAATPQGMAHFRSEFRHCLHDICALYPTVRLSSEPNGLRLFPSPTHVRESKSRRSQNGMPPQ